MSKVRGVSRFLNVIAGIALTFMMSLTVADVILRYFKRPIVGTYELVALSGVVVVGFAVPFTSWQRGNISMWTSSWPSSPPGDQECLSYRHPLVRDRAILGFDWVESDADGQGFTPVR